MARIDGDAGNNLEIGTSESDHIRGFGGIDLLRGGSGNDIVEGGDGPDSLYGDADDDTIRGGTGDDLIRGGRGADTLDGGAGRDMIRADRGDDRIVGSEGDDYIDGGDGYDTVDYSQSPPSGGARHDGVAVNLSGGSLRAPGDAGLLGGGRRPGGGGGGGEREREGGLLLYYLLLDSLSHLRCVAPVKAFFIISVISAHFTVAIFEHLSSCRAAQRRRMGAVGGRWRDGGRGSEWEEGVKRRLTWSGSMATPPAICSTQISLWMFIPTTSLPSITSSSSKDGSTSRYALRGYG